MSFLGRQKSQSTSVKALFEQHLDRLLAQDIAGWVKLWDADGVFEFPYAPDGYPQRLDGREAIAAYMDGFPDKIQIFSFDVLEFYSGPDGQEGVAEFTCSAKVISTGFEYNQHYISLIKSKNNKLTLYRDFWNPLVALKAFGGEGALQDAMLQGRADK